ncbi:hypothetical protein F8M41_025576 [Gigaspora margarita]|uniref:Uncharacterized protein n=1 Tax=Gigaspora margarita TaxID=4874 RepID=A0A8H4ESX3_GIGMA|nr:hypothetical protein F8M41_025576 [Gigaspora margarita]
MSLTQFRNSASRSLQRNSPENVSNRAYVVAFAIREAFATANIGNRSNGNEFDDSMKHLYSPDAITILCN